MRKLLLLFVIVCLGFMLVSCDDNDNNSLYDGDVTTHENPTLFSDLITEIKGVFED